jgi:hypothetical protein
MDIKSGSFFLLTRVDTKGSYFSELLIFYLCLDISRNMMKCLCTQSATTINDVYIFFMMGRWCAKEATL